MCLHFSPNIMEELYDMMTSCWTIDPKERNLPEDLGRNLTKLRNVKKIQLDYIFRLYILLKS
jgi:hypothetical protein